MMVSSTFSERYFKGVQLQGVEDDALKADRESINDSGIKYLNDM